MTLSACAAIVSVLLDVIVGAGYCAKLIRKKARPRIATWLIFEIGVGMSLTAYFSSHTHSALKAALNIADAAIVTVIVVALLLSNRRTRIRFTRNERLSLAISCVTLGFWGLTRTAWIAFVGFQIVMSVAYVPTIESVWHWNSGLPPEPAGTWCLNAVAALMGVVVDITGTHHDYLAMLYPLRACFFCVLVAVLVQRWKHKNTSRGSIS